MTPKQITEKDYAFFDNIDRYIIKGKSIELTPHTLETPKGCTSFTDQWGKKIGNEEMAKNMCNSFISIYKKLKSGKDNYTLDSDYKKDFAFLNYWTNRKIYDEFNESNSVSNFYDLIGSHVEFDSSLEFVNELIYDFDKDDLYNMNILYNLYENYSKLNAIEYNNSEQNKQVLTLSTACCANYIKGSYICNADNKKNSPIFCKKLEDFESKYSNLYTKYHGSRSEFADNLIKLSECPNNKIITTAVTGTFVGLIPLFGVLYKFTPMGQVLRSKIGILNNDISKNDEEMTNIPLMEQENESLKFKQGTYNIKYQSL
ncbi:VIR protein [Plasmodium vivax]|uniref:VIR protein n=1 Tax=Plasmodium vivax TaxID=5855 RepID=A0A1G4EC51_PLAVI|nr:VIR protein [Plasmodium vivax]